MFTFKLRRSPEERLQAKRERKANYLVKALPRKIRDAEASGERTLYLTVNDWSPLHLTLWDGPVETNPWQMQDLLEHRDLPPGVHVHAARKTVDLRGELVTWNFLIVEW